VTISFARGAPAPECLAVDELAEAARAALLKDGTAILSYGPVGGYGPLRELLAERHGVAPSQVFVTNGSLQGFDFLTRALAGEGRVLVEAPTYDRPLKLLAAQGADVVAVPMDDDGLDVEAVERAAGGAALLYTIPTFQNPSGRTLSLERRRRLAELAADGLLVLEDDPYGLVRFEGEPLPSVWELAGGRNVIYSSSFSKTIAPGLRVGWFVFPPELARRVEEVAVSTYITPALLSQATVVELVASGRFEPNLERVRGLLQARRDAMLAALDAELAGRARWSRPEGGYFLWLELPEGEDAGALLDRAAEAGVTAVRGSDFFPGGEGGRSAARLAYSFASVDEISEGVRRLAALV
jgi:2-aminoadipate transaminase